MRARDSTPIRTTGQFHATGHGARCASLSSAPWRQKSASQEIMSLCTVEPVDDDRLATNDQTESSDECSRGGAQHRSFPLGAFVRASSLHVGAAAAAAALRRDLVDTGRLSASAFDEAYAVARVTPGTNLLAMYTLLGERFARLAGRPDRPRCRCARSRAHRGGLGCCIRWLRWTSARSRGHAGRTCWSPCRIRVGDRETRPTAARAAPASGSGARGCHVGDDAGAADPAVRDSSGRRGIGRRLPED